ENSLQEIAPPEHTPDKQDEPEQPVEDGGLPLDESFVVKPDGGTAEDEDDSEAHPEHRLDLLSACEAKADLQQRGHDRHRGRKKDRRLSGRNLTVGNQAAQQRGGKLRRRFGIAVPDLVSNEKENHRKQIEQQLQCKRPSSLSRAVVTTSTIGEVSSPTRA